MSRLFAYCRVSTGSQTVENQILEIKQKGYDILPHRILSETISGSVPTEDRPVFQELLIKLEKGDTLIVSRLDRLGRDASDIVKTIDKLKSTGVEVISLDLNCISLTSSEGYTAMLMLAAMAERERCLIVERTQAGLRRAKEEGKKLGRKFSYSPEQAEEVKQAIASGTSIRAAATQSGLSAGTVQRIIKNANIN